MNTHPILKTIFTFLLINFLAFACFAQNSDGPKILSNTYYIKNCFVVKEPGTILNNQNVLIKDGIIAEISPTLKVPFDAQIIKADSMFLYAGFIDAYSNTGVAKPENKDRPKVSDPGNPPNDVAGITPQVLANDAYKSNDKSVADMRAAGFGISNVVPRGLMLPGQSSIFLLGEGPNDKMLLKTSTSQNFQLETSRGVYPSTSIAVIAKFRDLYRNANIAGTHQEKYMTNPTGLSRPDYSKELIALYPITIKKMPLYFVAQKTKDVHKAISLKEELGFDMVLAEVKQGWHYMDKIRKNNISVLLSLDLPEEEKKADTKKEISKDSVNIAKKDSIVKKEIKVVEVDKEKLDFDAKRNLVIKEYFTQASLFEKNGISFGFSFLNVRPTDVKKNIIKLIANGLSEKSALAALTTNPAKILGISTQVGTIEKGKIANIVITDKSYFDEKSSIKYVFVDGKKFDFTEKPKKIAEVKSDTKSLDGSWTYTVEIPGSVQTGKINITKEASTYKISVIDNSSPSESDYGTDINVDGKHLTFYIMADMGTPVKVDFDITFEEKSYTGNITVAGFGTFPIKGDYEGEPKN